MRRRYNRNRATAWDIHVSDTIIVQDTSYRGVKGFKADAFVSAIVLYVGQLSWLVDVRVYSETIAAGDGCVKHEHLGRLCIVGVSFRDDTKECTRECNRVVARVKNYEAAAISPPRNGVDNHTAKIVKKNK